MARTTIPYLADAPTIEQPTPPGSRVPCEFTASGSCGGAGQVNLVIKAGTVTISVVLKCQGGQWSYTVPKYVFCGCKAGEGVEITVSSNWSLTVDRARVSAVKSTTATFCFDADCPCQPQSRRR